MHETYSLTQAFLSVARIRVDFGIVDKWSSRPDDFHRRFCKARSMTTDSGTSHFLFTSSLLIFTITGTVELNNCETPPPSLTTIRKAKADPDSQTFKAGARQQSYPGRKVGQAPAMTLCGHVFARVSTYHWNAFPEINTNLNYLFISRQNGV